MKPLVLHFLEINVPQGVHNYMQHIYDLTHLKLEAGDTYNKVFEKLIERFNDIPEKLEAVNNWIAFNKKQIKDISLFENSITDENGLYAIFDFRPSK